MTFGLFVQVAIRRGWVIILVTLLLLGGALGYSRLQRPIYQATTTVIAYPSATLKSASDYTNGLSLLSYGSMAQTFVSLAQSKAMMKAAGAALNVTPQNLADYSAVATLLPSTTVLEISTSGPDKKLVIVLANEIAAETSAATGRYFRILTLSTLDPAVVPSVQVRPETTRNLLLAGVVGIVVGFAVAAWSLNGGNMPRRRASPEPGF